MNPVMPHRGLTPPPADGERHIAYAYCLRASCACAAHAIQRMLRDTRHAGRQRGFMLCPAAVRVSRSAHAYLIFSPEIYRRFSIFTPPMR